MHIPTDTPREAIASTLPGGQRRPIYYQGVPMQAHRNAAGALFLTIGPIHGPDSTGRAERMVEAVKQTSERD